MAECTDDQLDLMYMPLEDLAQIVTAQVFGHEAGEHSVWLVAMARSVWGLRRYSEGVLNAEQACNLRTVLADAAQWLTEREGT